MAVDIRPSPIAGTWYPGASNTLAVSVDRQLAQATVQAPPGTILGLVAPHAGHVYSGQVAAFAFGSLRGLSPRVIAIVSPFHQLHPGRVLTTAHEAYATPLGEILVERELLQRLEQNLQAQGVGGLDRLRRDGEHSLEIELPFLQRVLEAPFALLPLMLRDQSRGTAEAMGHALAEVLRDEPAVLVASTDLSHFYPDPIARQLDAQVLARVQALDPAGVLLAEDQGAGFACGRGALAAVLWACLDLGADRAEILRHATSGDVTGDLSSVVGYAAAVIYRSAGKA